MHVGWVVTHVIQTLERQAQRLTTQQLLHLQQHKQHTHRPLSLYGAGEQCTNAGEHCRLEGNHCRVLDLHQKVGRNQQLCSTPAWPQMRLRLT